VRTSGPGSGNGARVEFDPVHIGTNRRSGIGESGSASGGRGENLSSVPGSRQGQSGSVIGMSSHMSCRKVPMKNDMNIITKIAAGKV